MRNAAPGAAVEDECVGRRRRLGQPAVPEEIEWVVRLVAKTPDIAHRLGIWDCTRPPCDDDERERRSFCRMESIPCLVLPNLVSRVVLKESSEKPFRTVYATDRARCPTHWRCAKRIAGSLHL